MLLGPLWALLPLVLALLFPFLAFSFVAFALFRTTGRASTFWRLVATSFSLLLVVALALSRTSCCSSLVALLLPALLRLVSLLPTVVTKDVAEGSSRPREVAKSKLLLVVRETLPESLPVVAFSVENHVLTNFRAEALQ